MSNTTVEPIKRLTPAGQGLNEKTWKLPTLETREGWLSEARGIHNANKDRKAAEAWGKTMHAAREIMLIAAVDDANERTAYLAAKLAAAERANEVLRDTNRKLTGRLDAALLARDEARESRNAALKQRDALEGIIASLHERAEAEALSALAGVLDTEPVVFDGAPPQRTPHPRAHYHRWRLGSDEYVYHAHPEERDFPGHKHFHLDGHAMYYVPLAAADPPPEPTSEPPASEPDDDEQFAPGSGGDLR